MLIKADLRKDILVVKVVQVTKAAAIMMVKERVLGRVTVAVALKAVPGEMVGTIVKMVGKAGLTVAPAIGTQTATATGGPEIATAVETAMAPAPQTPAPTTHNKIIRNIITPTNIDLTVLIKTHLLFQPLSPRCFRLARSRKAYRVPGLNILAKSASPP
jgi:hypothetical protein